ncbi:InlB B-repeat-containing protein [Capnocytophaga granulosa]
MNFEFKIFGAPYTFDIYGSNREDINYFQLYDDGSQEKAKLTVHRRALGEVCYSYLRYNMISSSGRTGAFFGMAVIFKNAYCRDIENLYKLFEAVYQNISEIGILLQASSGSIQGRFCVANFSDAPEEVARIEYIIRSNLQKNYEKDILPINPSFSTDSNRIRRLSITGANAALLAALREYAYVSFSPEYAEPRPDILSKKYIDQLKIEERAIRDQKLSETTFLMAKIAPLSNNEEKKKKIGQDTIPNINHWMQRLKEIQNTITPYISIQPVPLEKINKEIQSTLDNFKNFYNGFMSIITSKDDVSKPEPPKPEPPKPAPNPLKKGSYSLEVKVKDEKGGVITGSRSGTYPVGSSIELKAVPSPGYRFVSWTEDEKVVCQTTTYSFQMYDRPMQLIAHFEAEQDSAWDLLWIRMVHFGAAIPKKVLLAIAAVIALILLLIFFYPSNTPQEGEEGTYKEGKKDTQAQIANGGILSSDSSEPSSEENESESLGNCNANDLAKYDIGNIKNLETIKEYIDKVEELKNNCPNIAEDIEKLYFNPAKERAEKIVEEELKKLYNTEGKKWIEKYKMVKDKITKYKLLFSNLSFDDYEEYYKKETIKNLEKELDKEKKWTPKKKLEIANDLLSIDPDNKKAKEEISKHQGTQGSGTQGSGTQGSGTKGSGTKGSGTKGSGFIPIRSDVNQEEQKTDSK